VTDEDLVRELRRLVDPVGGGIGIKPEVVLRRVDLAVAENRHETEMHDAYQRRARALGWCVCNECYQPFEWPSEMGLVTDGGKARAMCRECANR
jgi:hypothetical protein